MPNFTIVDYDNRKVVIPITSVEDLIRVLNSFQHGSQKFVDLIAPEGDILTMGIGPEFGCVQVTKNLGNRSYWVAINTLITSGEGFLYFDAGGTPTPVPLKWCLPTKTVLEIATTFFVSQTLYKGTEWEAI